MKLAPYIAVRNRYSNEDQELRVSPSVTADPVATFAMSILEKWGMVAGEPDGEDSSGRAITRPTDIAALVARAMDMSEVFFALAEARGHLIEMPNPYHSDETKDPSL